MTYELTESGPDIVEIDSGVKPPIGKRLKRGVWLSLDTRGGRILLNLDLEQADAIIRMLNASARRVRETEKDRIKGQRA